MPLRISVLAMLSVVFLLAACKKDNQFKVTNQGNPPSSMNPSNQPTPSNSQLPPGYPNVGQPQGGQMGTNSGEIPPPPSAPTEGGIDIAGLEKNLPRGWKKVTPASTMRLAQYKLPKASSDADEAECYVFYLGGNAGGVDANVERWFGQFTDQKDKSTSSATSSGKLKITYAEVAGNMGASMMSGGGAKNDYRLIGAIVETPAGPYFFKATGPDKSIKAQRDAIKTWLGKATANSVEQIEMH